MKLRKLIITFTITISLTGLCLVHFYLVSRHNHARAFYHSPMVVDQVKTVQFAPDIQAPRSSPVDNAQNSFHLVEGSYSQNTVQVHSAYYNRIPGNVTVLMLSEASQYIRKRMWPYRHFCLYYDKDMKLLSSHRGTITTRYTMTCPGTNPLPSYLHVTRNLTDLNSQKNPKWTIRVKDNEGDVTSGRVKQQKLALCIKIFYRNVNWLMLLQFVEYHLIQGVTKFFFKVRPNSLPQFLLAILAHYERLGLADLMIWDTIGWPICDNIPDKYCHQAQHMQCVLNVQYHYKFVGNIDIDELFVPQKMNSSSQHTTNLVSLLESMASGPGSNYGSFTFTSLYYTTRVSTGSRGNPESQSGTMEDWQEAIDSFQSGGRQRLTEHIGKRLPWKTWRNISSSYSSHHYSPKTISRPETVRKQWIHFVNKHYDGWKPINVKPNSQGYFIHFKNQKEWRQMKETYSKQNYSVQPMIPNSREDILCYRVLTNVINSIQAIFEQSRTLPTPSAPDK